MKAGKMRDRLTIQSPEYQGDGQGGRVREWENVDTIWARIQTVSASSFADVERFQENQYRTVNHYIVTVRYGVGQQITTDMRFIYNASRILEIESVVNKDEYNWEMSLYCREEGEI
jgi:SPP1 family predicted phage head-tail adaptor